MNSNKIYFWACDFRQNSGEGKLARMFIKHQNKISNYKFVRIRKTDNSILNYKYIIPFVGLLCCWIFYLKGKRVGYINYLPLWNFILFALLPPYTKLGLITGGANFHKEKFNFIRKYIFPLLYKISEFFINIRGHHIFSTDLLKKYLTKKTIQKSKFNYIFNFVKIKKINTKKNIDFLIYYRKHHNKKYLIPTKTIQKLILHGFDVRIIGDYLNLPKIKNYGYIANNQVKSLLNKTYFTLPSEENIYSIFILECIENNVNILVNKNIYENLKYFKKSFYKIELNKIKEIKRLRK